MTVPAPPCGGDQENRAPQLGGENGAQQQPPPPPPGIEMRRKVNNFWKDQAQLIKQTKSRPQTNQPTPKQTQKATRNKLELNGNQALRAASSVHLTRTEPGKGLFSPPLHDTTAAACPACLPFPAPEPFSQPDAPANLDAAILPLPFATAISSSATPAGQLLAEQRRPPDRALTYLH